MKANSEIDRILYVSLSYMINENKVRTDSEKYTQRYEEGSEHGFNENRKHEKKVYTHPLNSKNDRLE